MRSIITLNTKKSFALFLISLLSFAGTALANTLGHWRFEEGSFLSNSAGDGTGTLAANGTVPTQYSLPRKEPAVIFFNPLPFNGDPNNSAASFGANGRLLSSDVLKTNFAGGRTLSVEAMFNLNSTDAASGIASIWGSSSGYRTFFFSITDGELRGGTYLGTNQAFSSSLVVQAGIDYYAGMVVTGNATNDVIFYLQDLTNGGTLLTETVSFDPDGTFSESTFSNSNSGTNVSIASIGSGSLFNGVLDEVRIGNTALSPGQLMIVPEPSTYAFLAALLAFCGTALHRRKRP